MPLFRIFTKQQQRFQSRAIAPTYSAWIYEELKIAHSISESRPTPMMESWQVSHNISPFLESLETITLSKLSHIINS